MHTDSDDAGNEFQSTPSVWRETLSVFDFQMRLSISIHSLRMEGDYTVSSSGSFSIISIHSLRMEGDFVGIFTGDTDKLFQSTPSVWRETKQP